MKKLAHFLLVLRFVAAVALIVRVVLVIGLSSDRTTAVVGVVVRGSSWRSRLVRSRSAARRISARSVRDLRYGVVGRLASLVRIVLLLRRRRLVLARLIVHALHIRVPVAGRLLDAMRLLVVIECLALAFHLLHLLMMDVVDAHDVVDQEVVVVVVLHDDALRVPVVSVDVDDHLLLVLMMRRVLSHERFHRLEVLIYHTVDDDRRMLEELGDARRRLVHLEAAAVQWRQLNFAKVKRRLSNQRIAFDGLLGRLVGPNIVRRVVVRCRLWRLVCRVVLGWCWLIGDRGRLIAVVLHNRSRVGVRAVVVVIVGYC